MLRERESQFEILDPAVPKASCALRFPIKGVNKFLPLPLMLI